MSSQIFTPRYLIIITSILVISSFGAYSLSTNNPTLNNIEYDKKIDTALGYSINGDHTDAIKILYPLAQRGVPRAKLYLGVAYFHGNGVKKDYQHAKDIFFELQQLNYEPHIVNTYLNLIKGIPAKR